MKIINRNVYNTRSIYFNAHKETDKEISSFFYCSHFPIVPICLLTLKSEKSERGEGRNEGNRMTIAMVYSQLSLKRTPSEL